jgi:hypothetical protein
VQYHHQAIWEKKAAASATAATATTATAVDKEAASGGDDEDHDEDDDEGVGVDTKRLRAYEKSKLRWYYAVVECADVATASKLYREVDGLELERSACKFDLR